MRGHAFDRPDRRQHDLIEAGQTAVALMKERIGAERDDDLSGRDGDGDRTEPAGEAAVPLPEQERQHLDGEPAGIARVAGEKQKVMVAAERRDARRAPRIAGEMSGARS